MKRTFLIALCGLLGLLMFAGCAKKDDAVDAPLMQNAPPPPPRPDKPTITPSGGGSGSSAPKSGTSAP